jgi:hypothetical protein
MASVVTKYFSGTEKARALEGLKAAKPQGKGAYVLEFLLTRKQGLVWRQGRNRMRKKTGR